MRMHSDKKHRLTCKGCGKSFLAYRKNRKYHSRFCFWESLNRQSAKRVADRTVTFHCDWCGKEGQTINPLKRFCNRQCQGMAFRKSSKNKPKIVRKHRPRLPSSSPLWDEAARTHVLGYIILIAKDAEGVRYQRGEHIIMWERGHGKELPEGWVIHHVNEKRHDNRLENLLAMPRGDHMIFHNDLVHFRECHPARLYKVERDRLLAEYRDRRA